MLDIINVDHHYRVSVLHKNGVLTVPLITNLIPSGGDQEMLNSLSYLMRLPVVGYRYQGSEKS